MAWNKIGNLAALSFMLIFAACGGDSGNNASASEMGESQSSSSKSNQSAVGDKSCEDNSFFSTWEGCYCEDGVWACNLSTSSSSTPFFLSSSSDYGVKDKSSSSSSDKYDGGQVASQIVDKTISGMAQKGPFDVGSTVSLSQLDSKTFVQTGSSYTGKVTNTSGAFEISNVTLSSPYVIAQASGSYRSEITGKFSSGKVTLKSFADLSNESKVNINVLTHLTNNRITYLMSKGAGVSDAKKQAESEVLKIFGVKDDIENFESINLFGKNKGNAVLMAISIMMQRDLSALDINSLLSEFETDFEKTGKWDESAQAKIADWASAKDLAGGLDSIRNNIEKWKLGTVPDFEKYVRNYWYTSYGLGMCSKSREGEVLADTNKFSSNYEKKVRYICKDSAWRKASYIEMDTYKWEKGKDGEMKKGNVTDVRYIYDAEQGVWREPSAEEQGFGGCTLERENDIAQFSNVLIRYWYICKSRKWVVADTIEVDTRGWAEGADGEIKKGDSTSIFYKYDEELNKWIRANKNDTTLKLNGCTTKQERNVERSSIDNKKYVCKGLEWQIAQEIDIDTYGEICASEDIGKIINGNENGTNRYYCSKKGWVLITIDWSWDVPKEARLNPDISYGTITDTRDGKMYKTVKIGSQVWMAENLNYADTSKHTLLRGGNSVCYEGKDEYCEVAGRLYTWEAAILRTWGCDVVDDACFERMQGVCPNGWHVPDNAEWKMLFDAVGGKAKAATVLKSKTGWMNGGNGSDAVGFSAIPVGGTNAYGSAYNGKAAIFWTAISANRDTAWRLRLDNDSETASLNNDDKVRKYSVRCVKN